MPAESKDLIHRLYARISAGDLSVFDEFVTDDMVEHESLEGFEPNKEGVRQFFAMTLAAFPDFRMEPHEIVAEGDMACVRCTVTGTQQGEFLGVPASGRSVDVELFDMFRIRDGKVAEHWGVMDSMGMMQQLGAIPDPAAAA